MSKVLCYYIKVDHLTHRFICLITIIYKKIISIFLLILGVIIVAKSTQPKPNLPTTTTLPSTTPPVISPEKKSDSTFSLYTRVTPNTWPQISQFSKVGDIFWGPVDEIPKNMRALTFPNYETLLKKIEKDSLNNYTAVNWDSEGKDFKKEYDDAIKIRQFIDSYNLKHKNDTNFTSIKLIAFFHLNIIDAYPNIVSYPDIILVGKTSWNQSNIFQESEKYLKIIKSSGKIPGILLGEKKSDKATRTKFSNTQTEVRSNFESVISSEGLGLNIVGFYYDQDKADSLIKTLEELR